MRKGRTTYRPNAEPSGCTLLGGKKGESVKCRESVIISHTGGQKVLVGESARGLGESVSPGKWVRGK